MSKWSSYKEQQQLREGWRRFLNENTMQIAQEVWGMNGGDSFLGILVGVAKQVGLQIVEDPDRSKLVLDGPPEAFGAFLDAAAAETGIPRQDIEEWPWLQPYEKGRSAEIHTAADAGMRRVTRGE